MWIRRQEIEEVLQDLLDGKVDISEACDEILRIIDRADSY